MGERLAARRRPTSTSCCRSPTRARPPRSASRARSAIPFSEGLIKNRYIARTFIQPDQELRRQGVRLKFNPLAEVAGKRVVVVDDSIVRGNTTQQIVQMLFDAGAAEVHVRISSPPVIGQCFYGIDLADPDEMIATDKTVEEIREYIGATSLAYLSHDGLVAATKRPESELCRACLTREYPTAVPVEQREASLRTEVLDACAASVTGAGSQSSKRFPSGSVAQPKRPNSSSSTWSSTSTPAARSCASIASRSRTR